MLNIQHEETIQTDERIHQAVDLHDHQIETNKIIHPRRTALSPSSKVVDGPDLARFASSCVVCYGWSGHTTTSIMDAPRKERYPKVLTELEFLDPQKDSEHAQHER